MPMVKKILLCIYAVFMLTTYAYTQSIYIEYSITGEMNKVAGSTKIYYKNGNTRSVISVATGQKPAVADRVSLVLQTNPYKGYVLDETTKTYTEVELSKIIKAEADSADFEITVIGKEKIANYNCTHVKMKRLSQPGEQDIWLCKEIASYKDFAGINSKYTSPGFYRALLAKGVEGFPVRILLNGQANTTQIDLVSFEQKPLSDELFSIKGYTYNDNAAPAALQQMNQKLQQMTPGERIKFLDEMRKKQQEQKDNH